MTDIRNHLKTIRYFIIMLLFFNVLRTYISLKIPMIILFVLCPLIMANDVIRNISKKKNIKLYYFSLALSLIGAAILRYFINDFVTSIYIFFYATEILYLNVRIKELFLAVHCFMYLTTVIINTKALNITERLTTIGISLLTYLSVISVLYLSHAVRKEREETEKLYEELKYSNIKLQEYSLKVEELSIDKERQRVAQELHDSLGHSLMALTMHLEFAEKIFDKNPEKAKEVILKAKDISKNSTANLRKAVNSLKEERSVEDLRIAINELTESFEALGNIKINIEMNKNVEELNPEIKLCIYKTIRESLTNGMKHGKATAFNIEIDKNTDYVELNIKDNGLGCDTVIKSNGLKGIENRILALGGIVDFRSRKNYGFLIKAKIPVYEEVKS